MNPDVQVDSQRQPATNTEKAIRKRSRRLVLLIGLLLLLGLPVGGRHLWAYWHYREAQKAMGLRDFAGAQQHFVQSLQVWSTSTDVHLKAARAARKAGDFDETERLLHQCIDLGGDAEAIYLEQLLLKVQRGRLSEAEPLLVNRVLENHPDSVAILEVLTLAYIQTYQMPIALECVRRWLEREPDRLEAWLLRGYLYERLQNNAEALVSYRRAVEIDPNNDDARLQVAGQLAQSDVKAALAQFEYLRQKQGDTPPVLKGLAHCRRMMNQPKEAQQLLESVLAEHPRDWRALAERGRLALEYESAPEAEKWLRQAAAVAPHESDVTYSLCQCLRRLGKDQEAAEVLAKHERVEQDLDHMAKLSRDIAAKPHDPALRCEAGLLLLRNGLESEGMRWLESALVEDPRHAPTHQALADYYQRAGNLERVEQHRRLALEGRAPLAGGSEKAGH
ncbi:MAG TPA: tetratricopeptide repeat protein [Gemmataceae bacterium]|nr:tetratricopeptide repeat protein [Gemmataceae bacterium]